MPDEVSVREDLELIEVRSYGHLSADDMIKSRVIIANLVKEHGFTKVLVDSSQTTSTPSTMPTYEVAAGMRKAGIPSGSRIAIVTSEASKDMLRFFETVARNRGQDAQIFDSREAALEWLK